MSDVAGDFYTGIMSGIVVAGISAGVSIYSMIRAERLAINLDRSNGEHELNMQKLEHEHKRQLNDLKEQHQKNLQDFEHMHETKLNEFKARLRLERDAERARRDYAYEARKRLYQEYEPLLFQLKELSESAYKRIRALARDAREGHLEPGEGWLSYVEGETYYINDYYVTNIMYGLAAPLAIFRLMQRRLTLFDLDLEPSFRAHYTLAKVLYGIFADDFILAKLIAGMPDPDYTPHERATEAKKAKYPDKYTKQGLTRGHIDNLADALITSELSEKDKLRVKSFGEFRTLYYDPENRDKRTPSAEAFEALEELMRDFHPRKLRILWGVLLAQAHMYNLINKVYKLREESKSGFELSQLVAIDDHGERLKFDWRQLREKDKISDEVFMKTFTAAERYLKGVIEESLPLGVPLWPAASIGKAEGTALNSS